MPNEADTAQNPVRNIGKVQKFAVGTDFETYQLAKDIVAPISLREDSLTYDTIVERLQKQLKPQKSALVARYAFDNRSRNLGEAVSQYFAVLKHLATDCKFNEAMRLERLRDRLGIRDKKIMSELLKLKHEELTFDIAVAKCIAIEQSYKDVEALQAGKESNPVDLLSSQGQTRSLNLKRKLSLQPKTGSPSPKESGDQSCYRCLGNHDHKSCPYKKEKCHNCNKAGHIIRACKSKKRETQAADH